MILTQRISVTLFALLTLMAGSAFAAEPVAKSKFKGVAIGGHDSLAYHEFPKDEHKPALKGSKKYVVKYKGAKWQFGSERSRDLFQADPERYAPAYNGHCANALSLGKGLLRTDGTHWEIFGDKLYLFYAGRGRDRWLDGNWADYKVTADAEWQKIVGK